MLKKFKAWKILPTAMILTAGATTALITTSCKSDDNKVEMQIDAPLALHKTSNFQIKQHFSHFDNLKANFEVWVNSQIVQLDNNDYFDANQSSATTLSITLKDKIKDCQIKWDYDNQIRATTNYVFDETTNFGMQLTTNNDCGYMDYYNTTASVWAYRTADRTNALDVGFNYTTDIPEANSWTSYFDVTQRLSTSYITMKKFDISTNSTLFVVGENQTGKVQVSIPLHMFINPTVVTTGPTSLTAGNNLYSINFTSPPETYTNKGYSCGWNIFTKSGTQLNVDSSNQVVPVSSESIAAGIFGDRFDWLWRDDLGGCVNNNPVDDANLIFNIDSNQFPPPNFGGLKLQAVIYGTTDRHQIYKHSVICQSNVIDIAYTGLPFVLSENKIYDNPLFDPNDISTISFVVHPFEDVTYFKAEFDSYSGLGTNNQNPSDIDGNNYIRLTQAVTNDSNNHAVHVTLKNHWNQPEQSNNALPPRDTMITVNVSLYRYKINPDGSSTKQNKVCTVPISFQVMNQYGVFKVNQQCVTNIDWVNDTGDIGIEKIEELCKNSPTFTQNELFIPKIINVTDAQSVSHNINIKKITRNSPTGNNTKLLLQMYNLSFANDSQIVSIGKEAFNSFIYLKKIAISNLNNLTTIEEKAFYETDDASTDRLNAKTTSIVFPPNISTIGELAFASSDAAHAGLKTIDFSLFNYHPDIDPNLNHTSLTIGAGAFNHKEKLFQVLGSEYITNIGSKCFSKCDSLSTFKFSENEPVTLNAESFADCNSLTTIDFSTAKKIILPPTTAPKPAFSFSNSSGSTIYLYINIPTLNNIFASTTQLTTSIFQLCATTPTTGKALLIQRNAGVFIASSGASLSSIDSSYIGDYGKTTTTGTASITNLSLYGVDGNIKILSSTTGVGVGYLSTQNLTLVNSSFPNNIFSTISTTLKTVSFWNSSFGTSEATTTTWPIEALCFGLQPQPSQTNSEYFNNFTNSYHFENFQNTKSSPLSVIFKCPIAKPDTEAKFSTPSSIYDNLCSEFLSATTRVHHNTWFSWEII